jgi:hypothetical protein
MPTKTKTKPENATQSLAKLNCQLQEQATADWRRWAVQIASGDSLPDMRELVSAASALGIDDPAAAMQDDSEAVAEVRRAAKNIALCQQTADTLLEPWGGSLDKLDAAIVSAQRELERLKEIRGRAADGCSRCYWVDLKHNVCRKHPRLWPEYTVTGEAEVL